MLRFIFAFCLLGGQDLNGNAYLYFPDLGRANSEFSQSDYKMLIEYLVRFPR